MATAFKLAGGLTRLSRTSPHALTEPLARSATLCRFPAETAVTDALARSAGTADWPSALRPAATTPPVAEKAEQTMARAVRSETDAVLGAPFRKELIMNLMGLYVVEWKNRIYLCSELPTHGSCEEGNLRNANRGSEGTVPLLRRVRGAVQIGSRAKTGGAFLWML